MNKKNVERVALLGISVALLAILAKRQINKKRENDLKVYEEYLLNHNSEEMYDSFSDDRKYTKLKARHYTKIK